MNEAPAPLAIADLSDVLEQKFGPFNPSASKGDQLAHGERIRKYLANRTHQNVLTHEMGHSMGLRHNFVSSSDAFNFRPQYWQLRTNNGALKTACTTLDPTGETCVGPRSIDPVTTNERDNLLTMFMQSSTMEYAGEATQDMLGLGAYDFAAVRMFYGDVAPVIANNAYKVGSAQAGTALAKLDNFGGILGFRYEFGGDPSNTSPIHYSELQNRFNLISDCRNVDVTTFKPTTWNEERNGAWHPVLDGLIVKVNGAYSKCRQQTVDLVPWSSLRPVTASETSNTGAGNGVDSLGRVRWPYGFGTDRWADLGNLSVYRNDNGADPYELFDFLITQQEVNHIFDNYRRGRQTFSVRTAANRQLDRYNAKLRDAAKGLGLFANIYRDFSLAQGYDFDSLWPYIANELFGDNYLAAGIGFDHFAKELARPQAGPHELVTENGTRILRSTSDAPGNTGTEVVAIPNGATGYFGNVSVGGRLLENTLANNKGEYDAEYTLNAGSYYGKAYTAMLMTESVDNFISASRRDFLDGRYRAVSMADLFPDGYRRWLGNALTGDDALRGPRLASGSNGMPSVDGAKYPTSGLGFVSWWKPTPSACFQQEQTIMCDSAPTNSVAIDPQISWEQQKFLIAWTLMYLPENQQQTWLNQLGLWELGADTDPGFPNRIELHLPDGRIFIARTQGLETIMGKTVQKGVGARMLEWGNELLKRAYVTTDGPDLDGNGTPDWYVPVYANGKPTVKYDPSVQWIAADGSLRSGRTGCDANSSAQCTCTSNKACVELERYQQVPFFMRQAMRDYGLALPTMRGIY
ncbi:MAG: hypothetical protein JNG84_07660 [Archangium sp.]|nr:hypothetical protein [Archangium sp.]